MPEHNPGYEERKSDWRKRLDNSQSYNDFQTPIDIQEARVMPMPPNIRRTLIDIAVRNVLNGNAKKIVDETVKGTKELKDSVNAYMHRATAPSDKLINESIADHFRRLGK